MRITVFGATGRIGAAVVDQALEAGHKVVAVLSGVGPRGRKDGPVTSTATRAITQAMWETGVRRYVGVSAAPVAPPPPGDSLLNRRILHPFVGWLLQDLYADLALMEKELAATNLEWTVVRPPRLVSKPVTGSYRTAHDANVPRGLSISREDAAHLMLATLTDPGAVRHAIGLAY